MDLALMIAKSGLEAHHNNIEIISNNLANANTAGYKRSRAEFEDLPYQVMKQPGAITAEGVSSPGGLLIGTGTKLTSNKKIFTDGSQIQTGNAFDLAIKGRGFLEVQLANGSDVAYTRSGSLRVNEQGMVTTPEGYVVQPPITIPPGTSTINISQDGIVSAINSSNQETQIGQIQLNDFLNTDGLQPTGGNLYSATVASGTAITGTPGQNGLGTISQGALEGSNVNVVEEMVNLIEAQRAFEITAKSVSAIDNMLQYLNQTA